jgi:predicted nucleic acid-binding protein
MKVVLDSSAWIEWVLDSPLAEQFAQAFKDMGSLVVPSVCVTEVCRFVLRKGTPEQADAVRASMAQACVLPLDADIALAAAKLGQTHGLALADSLIYATARSVNAPLWTRDSDFKDLPGVRYFPKKKA